MKEDHRLLALRFCPHIYKDSREPFPIRFLGVTVFTKAGPSASFPKWSPDPAAAGAQAIIEYAIYYDYDIQHLYDLEHIWVAIDHQQQVIDCWCSFHGRRLRAAGIPAFRLEGSHPVLYAQPGKHAFLPDPQLFELLPQLRHSCLEAAGGGLLVPELFRDAVSTAPELDAKIEAHIRSRYRFEPSMHFVPEPISPEQLISWEDLRSRIPQLIARQLQDIL